MKKNLSVTLTRTESILGLIYLVFQIFVLPFVIELVTMLLGFPLSESELNFLFFAINFLCVTVIFRRYLIACGKISLSKPFACLRAALFGMLAYWVMSYALAFAIIFLYPDFYNVNDSSIAAMAQENFPLISLGTVILVPITEEILYRGLIFSQIYNKNRFLAYLVSTLAFSALHVIGYIGKFEPMHLLICLLQYVPASLCLAWAYRKADSIWAPILMHMTINQIAMLAMR